jgi:hypothetical protein
MRGLALLIAFAAGFMACSAKSTTHHRNSASGGSSGESGDSARGGSAGWSERGGNAGLETGGDAGSSGTAGGGPGGGSGGTGDGGSGADQGGQEPRGGQAGADPAGAGGAEPTCEDLSPSEERLWCPCLQMLSPPTNDSGALNCDWLVMQSLRAELDTSLCGSRVSIFLAPRLEPRAGDHGYMPPGVVSASECSVNGGACASSQAPLCIFSDQLTACPGTCQGIANDLRDDPSLVLWVRIWSDER